MVAMKSATDKEQDMAKASHAPMNKVRPGIYHP